MLVRCRTRTILGPHFEFHMQPNFYICQVNGVKLAEIMFYLYFRPSFCPSVSSHRCTASVNLFAWYNCFNRNIFVSCVKSWEYFRSDNISLETSLSWLSGDIVRFKIEMGVEEKCTKMLTPFPMDFLHTPRHAVIIDDVIIVSTRLLHSTHVHYLGGAYVNV